MGFYYFKTKNFSKCKNVYMFWAPDPEIRI